MFEAAVLGLEDAPVVVCGSTDTVVPPEICVKKTVLFMGSVWLRTSIEAVAAVATSVFHAVNESDVTPFTGIPNVQVVSLASPPKELRERLPLKWSQFNELFMTVLRVGLTQPGCTDDDDSLYEGLKLLAKNDGLPLHSYLGTMARASEREFAAAVSLAHKTGVANLTPIREHADAHVEAHAVACVVQGSVPILVVEGPMSNPKVYLQAVTRKAATMGSGFVAGVLLRLDRDMGVVRVAAMPTPGGSAEWLREPPFNGGGHPTWVGASVQGASLGALAPGKDLVAIVTAH